MNKFQLPVINLKATGARIRNLRMQNGYTVRFLAEYLLVSEQAVKKWQRGDCLPSLENLLALSELYHTHMEDLLVKDEGSSFFALWRYRVAIKCENVIPIEQKAGEGKLLVTFTIFPTWFILD